jgi:Icc-related predicted phosphoesterase
MKKVTAVLCIIALCTTLYVPSFAFVDTNAKADVLNAIQVLKGDGKGYNLSGTLTRKEAATFIVRMMGKEKLVIDNKSSYSKTKFTDVKESEWYAPYVGYCVKKGIIDGFKDSTFKPDDSISEKAFIKLTLGVLGYVKDVDFTWDNVYSYAYSIGLVKDKNYKTKTTDNLSYKRESVVNILFNALNIEVKGEDKTVVDSLINDKAITVDLALQAGLITDETVTDIEKTNVKSATELDITLNEDIEDVVKEQIVIYETDNADKTLTVTVKSYKDKVLKIKTSTQKQDKNYTLNIMDLVDKQGISSTIVKEFKGYVETVVKSDLLKVAEVKGVSDKEIDVFFTQPINTNAEVVTYYEILEDGKEFIKYGDFSQLSGKLIKSTNNGVRLYLKGNKSFNGNRIYTLNVKGTLTGAFGTKVNEGENTSFEFAAMMKEYGKIGVMFPEPIDKNTVKVMFNRQVDSSSGELITNYTIKENGASFSTPVNTAKVMADGKTVMLKTITSLSTDKTYEIEIKNVQDDNGMSTIDDTKMPMALPQDREGQPYIVDVSSYDNKTLYVFFDRPLDPLSAQQISSYLIRGKSDTSYTTQSPQRAYYDLKTPEMVILSLSSSMKDGESYELVTQTLLKDLVGNNTIKSEVREFAGTGYRSKSPEPVEVMTIGDNKVKVIFSRFISTTGNNSSTSNYRLIYTDSDNKSVSIAPISGPNFIDGKTIVLSFSNLEAKVYELQIDSIQDDTGITSNISNNRYGVALGQ